MRAVLLSAVPSDHPSLNRLAEVVATELATAGYDQCDRFEVTSLKLAFCQGEFDCWIKTPGSCRSHDAEMNIVEAVHDADALVFLDAVTFGGHGHALKTAIDRLLCLLEPFFTTRHELTHHEMRYPKHQRLYSIGWLAAPDADQAETFIALADANAVNYLAPSYGSVVVDDERQSEWPSTLRRMFEHIAAPGETIVRRTDLQDALLTAAAPAAAARQPHAVRRASLLVGSPKPKGTSASEVLATAIRTRLTAAGIPATMHFATEFVHARESALAAAREMSESDLLFLVTPLYVDSLPSLTVHALELIAKARAETSARTPARFAMLINCGFPEAEQNRTAMRIARHFASQAGYVWAGGLALGGGGVITPGTSLTNPDGPVANIVRALNDAVPSLATAGIIPLDAIETMAKSVMPEVFYRFFADLGWRWQAHRHGLAQRELHARPLDHPPQPQP